MSRPLLIVLAGLVAAACSSTTTGGGPGGGGGGSGDVVTGPGGAPGSGGSPGSGGAPGSTTGDGGADGGAAPTSSGGDGGAPIPVGDCVSEVSVVGGMCQTEYACDRGRVTVRCGGEAASCECLVDDVVVATCETPVEGQADTEQCWFPDNCCREALGAS